MYLYFQRWNSRKRTPEGSRPRAEIIGLLTILAGASSLFCQTATSRVASIQGDAQVSTATPLADSPLPGIFGPGVLAGDGRGNMYVVVPDGVFKIDSSGTHQRIAGIEKNWRYSGDSGPAIRAGVNPRAVAADADGNLYLADTGNHRIRKLDTATGIITTVAGNGVRGFFGDGGVATSARLDGPTGVAVDFAGNLYIADGTGDGNDRIREVAARTGVITTVAGNGSQGYSGDGGPAILAQFSSLGGLATDRSGNLYIADNFNNRIRMVSASTGMITTVAGAGSSGYSGDGGLAVYADLNNPLSVAVDAAGDLYIADSGNFRVRKVDAVTGVIATAGNGGVVYRDAQHGFPCALAFDASGALHVADSGISQVRRVSVDELRKADAFLHPSAQAAGTTGFKINVTYDTSVPAAAQTAFNSVISTYESVFTTNITVNIDVSFGETGLGQSDTSEAGESYSAWRSAMIANATANSGNTFAADAASSLPATDPIGNGTVILTTANARALGFTANTSVDSSLMFSNAVTFEYTGVASSGTFDFMDVATHELDEALGIGSALTGLANNAALPTGYFSAEDYFRYSAANTRSITTNPNAVVYFSYDGGTTNLAQFNQAYSALGDSDLDRNDWVYGDFGCPAAIVHIQDAIACSGQAVPVGSGPEVTVLLSMGYDSSVAQTITFGSLPNVSLGVAPFSISASASSGLTVTLTSTTTSVCTLSGSTVTVIAAGTCSITANQAGNATYSAAPPVTQSFTVSPSGFPAAPALVAPANGAAGVSLMPTLSWGSSSGATSYDVYFGTSATPPLATNTTSTSYTPATLTSNTAYHWKIVAKNSTGSESSSVFSFTTFNSSCSFAATPALAGYAGGPGSISVTAGAGCAWTALSNASWLTITSGSGNGNGTLAFTASPNSGTARLAAITVASQPVVVMEGGSPSAPLFNDVPPSDPFFDYISLMSNYGITAGCSTSPPLYCPDTSVTRAQMAVFIVAGLDLAMGTPLTYTQTPYFQDVASTSSYFPFVQRIKDLGITAGCTTSPPLFCPSSSISQGQMAVFVIVGWMVANQLSTFTYTTTPYFTDVPATDPYFKFIQKMRDMGFWTGCSATEYCEGDVVTREQMAPMIMRSLFGAP